MIRTTKSAFPTVDWFSPFALLPGMIRGHDHHHRHPRPRAAVAGHPTPPADVAAPLRRPIPRRRPPAWPGSSTSCAPHPSGSFVLSSSAAIVRSPAGGGWATGSAPVNSASMASRRPVRVPAAVSTWPVGGPVAMLCWPPHSAAIRNSVRPVRAPEHAGEAAAVKLDRLQHLTAFADAHAALVGDVPVPDGALGVEADAVGDAAVRGRPTPAGSTGRRRPRCRRP